MDSVTVGLDIGSSAVRAAEIQVTKDGARVLRRYAQVGLPHGAVVDGEVNNIPGVAAALKRLWSEGGFSTTKVVLGVSGPRVFVRQADVPAMSADDVRSSLKFGVQEMIPISMEDASFDFGLLGQPEKGDGGSSTQRILLVAAHRDLLRSYMAVLKDAGLTATVMDAAPLALCRAVPAIGVDGQSPGVEVIVSIGAELTTVAVREDGVPRFIRSLTVGGSKLTETIANTMHLQLAVAERLKRGAVPPDSAELGQARRAMSAEMRELAEEVRATIDFFMSQSGQSSVDRLVITGGAAQTEGLALSIGGNLPVNVMVLDPLATFDTSSLGFDHNQLSQLSTSSATAIGLALWPTESQLIRLSVLPEEVQAAQKARQLMTMAGAGLGGLAVLLGLAGAGQWLQLHSAQDKVHAAQVQAAALSSQVTHLQALTAVHGQLEARSALEKGALQGDIDWVRVVGQLASAMPQQLSLTSFSGTRSTAGSGGGSTGGSTTASVGTVNMAVTGGGGLPSASAWLTGLATDLDLSNVTIGGINVQKNGGGVTFSTTASLTPDSHSNRAEEVQK